MGKQSSSRVSKNKSVLAPENLPYQLFLLVQQMTNRFQTVLRPHGLTPLHWGILCCLWAEDGLKTTEIARRLDQLGGTITVGLDAMVRDGLVERQRSESDKRVTRVLLTERGRGLRQRLEEAANCLVVQMFSPITPAQYSQLQGTVNILRKHLAESLASTSST